MKLPFGFEIVKRRPTPTPNTPVVSKAKPQARKRRSHCKNGHLKDAANTVHVGGQDRCRTCYLAYNKRKKAERASGR